MIITTALIVAFAPQDPCEEAAMLAQTQPSCVEYRVVNAETTIDLQLSVVPRSGCTLLSATGEVEASGSVSLKAVRFYGPPVGPLVCRDFTVDIDGMQAEGPLPQIADFDEVLVETWGFEAASSAESEITMDGGGFLIDSGLMIRRGSVSPFTPPTPFGMGSVWVFAGNFDIHTTCVSGAGAVASAEADPIWSSSKCEFESNLEVTLLHQFVKAIGNTCDVDVPVYRVGGFLLLQADITWNEGASPVTQSRSYKGLVGFYGDGAQGDHERRLGLFADGSFVSQPGAFNSQIVSGTIQMPVDIPSNATNIMLTSSTIDQGGMVGDLNDDGLVDEVDRAIVDALFDGTTSVTEFADAAYTPYADFNLDGVINQTDLNIFDDVYDAVADLNFDGVVDVNDQLLLLANWGTCGVGFCIGDLNQDGFVDVDDLLRLLGSWN